MKKHFLAGVFAAALLAGFGNSAIVYADGPAVTVSGKINDAAEVVVDDVLINAVGAAEIKTSIFVMGEDQHQVEGVLLRDLMKKLGTKSSVAKVSALDGYTMEVPTEDFMKYDVVLATKIDGKKLSVRDKGPAWIIYPASQHPELKDTVYEARSVWQIKSIEFM